MRHAFNGIRACGCALSLDAVLKLGKRSVVDLKCLAICAGVLLLSMFTPGSPAVLVVGAGVRGILLRQGMRRAGERV